MRIGIKLAELRSSVSLSALQVRSRSDVRQPAAFSSQPWTHSCVPFRPESARGLLCSKAREAEPSGLGVKRGAMSDIALPGSTRFLNQERSNEARRRCCAPPQRPDRSTLNRCRGMNGTSPAGLTSLEDSPAALLPRCAQSASTPESSRNPLIKEQVTQTVVLESSAPTLRCAVPRGKDIL